MHAEICLEIAKVNRVYGDKWKRVRPLDEGGQAHTYLVTDQNTDAGTQYVLKRLKNLDRVDRFRNEIETVARLDHPNVLKLMDYDLNGSPPYLVSEYCAGGSLDKANPYWNESFPSAALDLFIEICEGVAYCHDNGVIHRDLKPANVFLRTTEGPAVVGDFGLCQLHSGGERVTLIDEAVGPRHYRAPELEDARVDQASPRSDSYSLGKILYWLLSGGRIFSREKHREREWDLVDIRTPRTGLAHKARPLSAEGWRLFFGYVNRNLLDSTIAADVTWRYDVKVIKTIAQTVRRTF